jgi:hypothetical protein
MSNSDEHSKEINPYEPPKSALISNPAPPRVKILTISNALSIMVIIWAGWAARETTSWDFFCEIIFRREAPWILHNPRWKELRAPDVEQ